MSVQAQQRFAAAVGASIFFALAPGTLAGLIPRWLTGWHPRHTEVAAWIPFRVLGGALIAAALPVLVAAFVRFVSEGIGTPNPLAPTEHLVVGGPGQVPVHQYPQSADFRVRGGHDQPQQHLPARRDAEAAGEPGGCPAG